MVTAAIRNISDRYTLPPMSPPFVQLIGHILYSRLNVVKLLYSMSNNYITSIKEMAMFGPHTISKLFGPFVWHRKSQLEAPPCPSTLVGFFLS